MHSISRINLFSLLAVFSILVGMATYANLTAVKADTICTDSCGSVTVTITGADSSGTAMVAGIDITKPDGTKAPTDSAQSVREDKTSQRSLQLTAGSGYSVALSFTSSKYQVKNETGNENPRTVTITAGQTTEITFNLEIKDSRFIVLHNIANPDGSLDTSFDGRFLADIVATDASGKTYNQKLTHTNYSSQDQPYWMVRPGQITVEMKNINPDYELSSNPQQTLVHAGLSQSIDILFKKKATADTSKTGTGGASDPTPTPTATPAATATLKPTDPPSKSKGNEKSAAQSSKKSNKSTPASTTASPTVAAVSQADSVTPSPTASSSPAVVAAERHAGPGLALVLAIIAGLAVFGLGLGAIKLRGRLLNKL